MPVKNANYQSTPKTYQALWVDPRKRRLSHSPGRFKDAELLEGVESVSGSQLDEMCTEHLQKQNGFFFPVIKKILEGRHLDDIQNIKVNTMTALMTIPEKEFQNRCEEWARRWRWCIASQGEYFEGAHSDIQQCGSQEPLGPGLESRLRQIHPAGINSTTSAEWTEKMAQRSTSSSPKPQSRAENQAQVHLTPKSVLLYSIHGKGQAGRAMAGPLVGNALCLCHPYPPASPGGVHFYLITSKASMFHLKKKKVR
ncbi:uncharacterized protein RBU33_027017 isoform 1-T4 [Hipposideros larvatus]